MPSDPGTTRPNEFPPDSCGRIAGNIRRHCFVPAPATAVGAHAPIECRSRRRGNPAMGLAQQKRRAVLIVEDDAELCSLTAAISRSPRGQRPLSRTMFVLVAVSSINTSRAGSSMPCSRTQRRRARATSARFCSAACRFFSNPVVWQSEPRSSPNALPMAKHSRRSVSAPRSPSHSSVGTIELPN